MHVRGPTEAKLIAYSLSSNDALQILEKQRATVYTLVQKNNKTRGGSGVLWKHGNQDIAAYSGTERKT